MEVSYYSINNLRAMEIIDINSGVKLGYIKDLKIDTLDCKVLAIILPSQKMSWFGKNTDIEIPWDKVKKIGLDVILVDGSEFIMDKS
ncbi:PRC-barrel domain protein [Clostridium liquoris]|jgi:YlmC/YmxH family sporulation protein|uniref:PRC-barrel domain protein n=1 Tax=Clostridium liquoris TaxID=1289519 RepID=A0A2T0B3X5_9CLOT|nr:YlmC/YmxH family sporulation protein [Clostridium liquoris]PRR78590.1 PRC-barrel domain protein [Clostridium liquoris]